MILNRSVEFGHSDLKEFKYEALFFCFSIYFENKVEFVVFDLNIILHSLIKNHLYKT